MGNTSSLAVFWFRRDLRLEDNPGLFEALTSGQQVLPLFIFDDNILSELPENDARVTFIHDQLSRIDQRLKELGSGMLIKYGSPSEVWKSLIEEFKISKVIFNLDYEPYAIDRDNEIILFLEDEGIEVINTPDHLLVEPGEVMKADGLPYSVYTPFSRRWLEKVEESNTSPVRSEDHLNNFWSQANSEFLSLEDFGFVRSSNSIPDYDLSTSILNDYAELRDYPAASATSMLGPHLRFGTIGIRQVLTYLGDNHLVYLKELGWREFFAHILYHFPRVVDQSFKHEYDYIKWENNPDDFQKWCEGKTGFPIVDAGMRELNATGTMHNRVRMIVGSFLVKDLLIDWKWGEAYFAEKLLDFELASNNGNWQWVAGCGCDAAPYFRIFNPDSQQQKFDPRFEYIKKWIPEFGTPDYPQPMVDHSWARKRTLEAYKAATSIRTAQMAS